MLKPLLTPLLLGAPNTAVAIHTNGYQSLPDGKDTKATSGKASPDGLLFSPSKPVKSTANEISKSPYQAFPPDIIIEIDKNKKVELSSTNARLKELDDLIKESNTLNGLITDDLNSHVKPYLIFRDFTQSEPFPYLDLLAAATTSDAKQAPLMKKNTTGSKDYYWFVDGVELPHIKAFLNRYTTSMEFGYSEMINVSRAAEALIRLLADAPQRLEYNKTLRFFGFEDSPAGLLALYIKKVEHMLTLKKQLEPPLESATLEKVAKEAVAFNQLKADFNKVLPLAINNFRFYERACCYTVTAEKRDTYQPLLRTLRHLLERSENYLGRGLVQPMAGKKVTK